VARGRERQVRNLQIRREGDQLIIRPERNIFDWRFRDGEHQTVLITVEMPQLSRAELTGAVKADIAGFDTPDFTLSASGAVESAVRVNSRKVRIDATGACKTTLAGSGEQLDIDGTGACEIRANRFRATHANVELTGASNARVFVTGRLNAEVAGPSHITYQGNPQVVNADESGIGRIEKE
jgi:hypothetical protein